MDRIKASVLILALILAPIASFCGAQSVAVQQCPAFCPMHRVTQDLHEQTDGMPCHHEKSAEQECLMKSGCGKTMDLGLASPLPQAVLFLPFYVPSSAIDGTLRSTGSIPSMSGFLSPPFEPPRA
jgi:hypothetical protein